MQLAGKKTMIWINNRILRLSWQCFKTVPVYAQLFNVLFCIFIIVPRHESSCLTEIACRDLKLVFE